ncbi:hypothetical protein [Actinokineospora sp. NPDC004072]
MSDDLAASRRERLARLTAELDDDPYAGLDPGLLCLVSLLPRWTSELVQRLDRDRPEQLRRFIEQLFHRDIVDSGMDDEPSGVDGPPRTLFWVRERCRRDIGELVRDRLGAAVQREYASLCARVERHQPERLGLRLWLEVRQFHGDPSGRRLMDRIESLLKAGDVAAAESTVATAEVVGDVLGGSLDVSVKRAQWRLDRQYRDNDDLRHLEGYFRRRGIESALRELVTSPDGSPTWALHLRGHAGVGKTMVLRYLGSSQFARDHGIAPFPVARVDFDHLSPRYPEQRPMELLIALSDQLLRFAPSQASEWYYQEVRRSADDLATAIADPDGLGEARRAELLAAGVRQFAELANAMDAPVVLVLDTCEEIGKHYAPGVAAPAIDRTFELLEQLRAAAPRVRVVFAGRRWLVPPEDPGQSGPSLQHRAYLTELPITGFTEAEAREFLRLREVPERLVGAVLRLSVMGVPDRYIPFDLDAFSAWVRDDPDLTEADLLGAGNDPYIQRRIVARIRDAAVSRALPVAVAYGRFDQALITPALTRLRVDPAAAFHGLAGQEWVTTLATAHGRPSVLEVSDHIRDRLRKVLAPDSPLLANPEQLGRDAAAVLAASPLAEVAAETAEAAMRLLPAAESWRVWQDVERRVVEEGEWWWANHVANRVCDAEPARSGGTVLAAVRATQAAAVIHSANRDDLARLWDEVLRHAGHHPDREHQRCLALRAALGRIAAGEPIHAADDASVVSEGGTPEAHFAELVSEAVDLRLVDSAMAAIDTVAATLGPERAAPFIDGPLDALTRDPDPHVAAHAEVWLNALGLARGQADTGRMLDAVRQVEAAGPPRPWRDWQPAPGLLHRARLLPVLNALRGGDPVAEDLLRRWRDDALPHAAKDIDADRLVAAVLDHELTRSPASPVRTRPAARHPGAVPWLHFRLGRPLAMAVADAIADPADAAALLRRLRDAADPMTADSCDLALLRLCRRQRTTRYARDVHRMAADGSPPRVRDEALLVLRMVNGTLPRRERPQASPYGHWRCFPDSTPPEAPDWPADHIDEWEVAALTSRESQRIPDGSRAQGLAALMAAEILHGSAPEQAARFLSSAEAALRAAGDDSLAASAARLAAGEVEPTEDEPVAVPEAEPGYDLPRLLRPLSALVLVMGVAAVFVWVDGMLIRLAALGLALVAVLPTLVPMRSQQFGLGSLVTIRHRRRGSIELTTAATAMSFWPTWGQAGFLNRLTHAPTRSHEVFPAAPKRIGRHPLTTSLVISRSLLEPRGTRYPVCLDIAEDLHLHDWERWIGQARFRRTFPFRLVPGARRPLRPGEWRARSAAFAGPGELLPADADPGWRGDRRLLYLVGAPVRVARGLRFAVHGGSGPPSEDAVSDDRVSSDVGQLTTTPTSVLVLQAPPVVGGPMPLATARNDYLRCAVAAAENGVDTVLVIPPLPYRAAAEVVQRIWRAVADSPGEPSTAGLFALVAEVRDLVVAAERGASPRPRADLDVVFFHRPLARRAARR